MAKMIFSKDVGISTASVSRGYDRMPLGRPTPVITNVILNPRQCIMPESKSMVSAIWFKGTEVEVVSEDENNGKTGTVSKWPVDNDESLISVKIGRRNFIFNITNIRRVQ